MTSLKRKFIPMAVIGSAFVITGALVSSRPKPKRVRAAFQAPLVETMTMTSTTTRILVASQGTVSPARQIKLLPEVAGRITWVSEKFVPGGQFKKGEAIAKIDSRNYETMVAQRKAQLQQTLLNLELEKGRKRVAEREWGLLQQDLKSQSKEGRALALREPQLRNAEANVKAAEQALQKASLDLSRTQLRAPFNAVVLSKSADLGQVLGAGSPLGSLAGTDKFWVETSIPLGHVAFLDLPKQNKAGSSAQVLQRSEGQASIRDGKLIRVLSNLDPVGRMARVIVQVDDPLKPPLGELPLFLGSFTDVNINGKLVKDVYEIPEEFIQNNREVFILTPENELDIRAVKIIWKTKKSVLIEEGIKDGERVIGTRLPTPVQGMKLRTKAEAMKRKPIPGERS